jgi:hypothetical protein
MTFDREFFGRRFAVVNNRVATGIPWTPGQRQIRYTYVLRNTQQSTAWLRPLDLPCESLTVRIEGKAPDEVRCDLLGNAQSNEGAVVFTSNGQMLPAGKLLRVQLGRLPLPWMAFGKWFALAILAVLMAAASWLQFVVTRVVPLQPVATERRAMRERSAA